VGRCRRGPRDRHDEEAIGRLAGEHLLGQGFVHLAFIPRPMASWSSDRRLAGFRELVEARAGRACRVFDGHDADDGDASDANLTRWLIDLPKPAGVFTARDDLAAWAVAWARRAGLRVPRDVAIMGSTDNEWVSACSQVPLSSVKPDYRAVGYRAAKLLDALMAGETPPTPQWLPPLGVVTRTSTDIVVQRDPLVNEVLLYIRDHFADDITVEQLLDEVGVSRRSLEMRMKKAIGQTPQAAIHTTQIDQAKVMLASSRESIGEIARACGFALQPRFNRVFKRLTGMTPGAYREQHTR